MIYAHFFFCAQSYLFLFINKDYKSIGSVHEEKIVFGNYFYKFLIWEKWKNPTLTLNEMSRKQRFGYLWSGMNI